MNIRLTTKKPETFTGELAAWFVAQPEKGAPVVTAAELRTVVERANAAGDFSGKEGQTLMYYPPVESEFGARRLLLVGLGKQPADNQSPAGQRETVRKAGGTVAGAAVKARAGNILIALPEVPEMTPAEVAECLTEGLIMGGYRFLRYKKKQDPDEEEPGRLESVSLYSESGSISALRRGLNRGRSSAESSTAVREMANEPANVWTPARFADFGRGLAREKNISCTVLSRADMKRLGLNGILAVNSGSAQPPKLVIVEYRSGGSNPTLLLVGKGLTFDAGGISIKPSHGMEEMKYDMCGGAVVLAVMQAVAREGPTGLNVVAMVPATENLPGPAALKPGDILTMYGGRTVEVINTDAEGRLILADALAYGIKKFKPDTVIDVATLTGAVVVGLGHHRTGLFANRDELAEQLLAAGDHTGEPLWRLPLGPEYSRMLKSEVADIKNLGNRTAGSITAAAFLQEFVGETGWAHLDIAGTAYNFTEKSYVGKGASGVGARTLLEFIRNYRLLQTSSSKAARNRDRV